jgi:nicotinamide-nucleotide amidase
MQNDLAQKLHAALRASKKMLALAESCTGGAIAQRLTAIAGASDVLQGSVVAYSDTWKHTFLGVSKNTLKKQGAVSLETVQEMAQGLLDRTDCHIAAAISGIAGPTGGTPEKPVGTVYLAIAVRGEPVDAGCIHLKGDRGAIIEQTVQATLNALWHRIAQGKRTLTHG